MVKMVVGQKYRFKPGRASNWGLEDKAILILESSLDAFRIYKFYTTTMINRYQPIFALQEDVEKIDIPYIKILKDTVYGKNI